MKFIISKNIFYIIYVKLYLEQNKNEIINYIINFIFLPKIKKVYTKR